MKYDFIVLGADGIQGRIATRDLLESGYTVFVADLYRSQIDKLLKKYKRKIEFAYVDLRDINMAINVIEKSGAKVVVNCAEGDWNLNVYKACLETKNHCLDLGSYTEMTEEQLKMDHLFRKIKRTAITGCGSVPGIGNVMLRHAAKKFDRINSIEAGFAWDSNIKKFIVPFSIESILGEFTLPVPIIENGRKIKRRPLKTIIQKYYKSIGYQKSFLTDHAEVCTFYHYYKNKGVKNIRFFAGFPEHSFNVILTLIKLGFNDEKPVEVKGVGKIRPTEFLTQLLKRIKIPKKYREWENLWVEIKGIKNRKKNSILMECLVPTLPGREEAGCNIDTGMPASIIAQMIKKGEIKKSGSFAPEAIVPEKLFFKRLRRRKMLVYENGELIN